MGGEPGRVRAPGALELQWRETALSSFIHRAGVAGSSCHLKRHQIPDDYVWVSARIPDHVPVDTVILTPPSPAEFGTMWLKSANTAVLSIPSVIVPERNYLLNPLHEDFAAFQWSAPEKLIIGVRLTWFTVPDEVLRASSVAQ